MRIRPPVVEVPEDDPYANDLFQRKSYGDSLTSALQNIDERVVLCIDAPWGEGKTTFARMWRAALAKDGIRTIYYDAYEHDYSDDPFVSFCAEIVSVIETEFSHDPELEILKQSFLDKAKKLGSKLLSTGIRTGVKALSLNVFGEEEIKDLFELGKICAETKADSLYNAMGDAIQEYQSRNEVLRQFKQVLLDLGTAIRERQGFPLVIVIDELDRCRPDFAFNLLERVKHLFSAESVSFVVFANTSQLEEYVKYSYGAGVDARNYLHKFFTLTSQLPKNKDDLYESDTKKYYNHLLAYYELVNREHMMKIPHRLFEYFDLTLREMERVFSLLSLYCAQDTPTRASFEEIVVFLAIMYVNNRSVFDRLARGQISYDDLCEETRIVYFRDKEYPDCPDTWFLDFLVFLTTPVSDYDRVRKANPDLGKYETTAFNLGLDRHKILPILCDELVKFKI